MRNLLAFLLFVPSLCLAQLPDGVPSNGLIAYYGFSNNGLDATGSAPEMLLVGSATYTSDRFGQANSALYPNGGSANTDGPFFDYGWGEPFTFAIWFTRPLNTGGNARLMSTECPEGNFRIANDAAGQGVIAQLSSYMYVGSLSDSWHHLVYTYDGDSTKTVFLDGSFHSEKIETGFEALNYCNPLALGRKASSASNDLWPGLIDDVGIWDRALDPAEVITLYTGTPPEYGCTDQTACNFDPLANSDDSTCEYGCLYCGPGTHWDAILSACVADVPSAEAAENCTLMSLQELTEGYLNLLDIVAYQDSLLTAQQGGDQSDGDGTTTNWTCGDPLPYQGYDYATVLIGNQCWFAENLKSSKFRDGEELILAQSDSSWEANAWTYAYCTVEGTSNNLEFLYKGGVVENPIEICPSGWHIPFDQDWMDLETELGMPDSALTLTGTRGSTELVGGRMKSNSTYWDSPNVLASDPSGFNAEPCGYRNHLGYMYDQNATTHFWNADPQGGNDSHARVLFHDLGGVYRYSWNGIGGTLGQRFGRSIRCIKD